MKPRLNPTLGVTKEQHEPTEQVGLGASFLRRNPTVAVSLGYAIKPLTHIREMGLFKLFLLDDIRGRRNWGANLVYMRAFAEAWPEPEFVQQAAAQLPWPLRPIDKLKTREKHHWHTT